MTEAPDLRYKILYADDDEDDRQLLTEVFAGHSPMVQLICFENGARMLTYLNTLPPQEASPCLVILDINMPLMNGKETLKKMRAMERFSDVPVILFSTSTDISDKQFARAYNAGFITKPVEVKQLQATADIFLEHCAGDVKKQLRTVSNSGFDPARTSG